MTPAEVETYLRSRALLEFVKDRHVVRIAPATAAMLQELFEVADQYPSAHEALKAIGVPQSTAIIRLRRQLLPTAGQWWAILRALRVVRYLQKYPNVSLDFAAMDLGYGSHAAISRMLRRMFGIRAKQVRQMEGWESLFAAWWERQDRRSALGGGVR